MNQESKTSDPRFWEKWNKSGAVGNFAQAQAREQVNKALSPIKDKAMEIDSIGYFHERDISTLSIGRKVVNKGEGWSVYKPECVCVVPGNNFEVGQMVTARDLPKSTQTIEQAFPAAK